MTPFERKVLTVVSRIPVGRVTTYGDVARLAGRPGAARAVGNILREADEPGLPYHRVIAAGGKLGGYSEPVAQTVAAGRRRADRGAAPGGRICQDPLARLAREAGSGEVSPKRQSRAAKPNARKTK